MGWKAAHAGLRELVWAWDPIGVAELAPDDEYDCIIGRLHGQLKAGTDRSDLGNWLRHDLVSHFGLSPTDDEIKAVAGRIMSWWATAAQTEQNG